MKIAMISSWHVHARGYANDLRKREDCEIVAVWDERKAEGMKWAEDLNCPFVENYDDILNDKDIDGVVITSPTSMHTELIIRAANAGKHIFAEKVLALTYEDCCLIKDALKNSNSIFTISYPHRCRSGILCVKQLIDDGKIGDVTYARIRNVHDGSLRNWLPEHFYNKEQCGGGAMIDLGTHPVYLLNWFLGMPKKITSSFTHVTGREVEDNAVSVMEFDNGAIGVAETGFVSVYSPFSIEICGTKGVINLRGNDVSYVCAETEGKTVNVEQLPQALPAPIYQWVDSVLCGKEVLFGIDAAMSLTKIMQAAYKSQNTSEKVDV